MDDYSLLESFKCCCMKWFVTWLTMSDVTAYLLAAADVVSSSSTRQTSWCSHRGQLDRRFN